ncbi:LytTR family DNA-binding domain-containing protein [Parabacteroides sp. Marseille-P3160]|uniref:LytTR family DNA-binding domain-containing protein n=1 Tax=Parabacteroides sp. Marseille-P3160 TaxID=1917887 RepID=UPI0009B9FEDF|nr:LytTR family DNA-binding domain-containing protein [Parabacteroides sp. Marseille-P3160]
MKKGNILFCDRELIVEESNKVTCLYYYDILDVVAEAPYTTITTIKNKKVYLETPLSQIAKRLPSVFFQCNRSVIVNLIYVSLYEKEGSFFVLHAALGKKYIISSRKKNVFRERLHYVKTHFFRCEACLSCRNAVFCEKFNT